MNLTNTVEFSKFGEDEHYSPAGDLGDNHVAESRSARYRRKMKRDGRSFDHATLEAIRLTWVRGHETHALNPWPKSVAYRRWISGVCL
jgi:hypothetical protein